jgi:hypothetical protein
MSIPALPSDMSSDGREVWDWADRLSDHVQRVDEYRRLSQQIRNAETQCGGCSKWMTGSCPRERHDNKKGHKVGPSSLSPKCQEFTLTARDQAALAASKEKLMELGAQLNGKNP